MKNFSYKRAHLTLFAKAATLKAKQSEVYVISKPQLKCLAKLLVIKKYTQIQRIKLKNEKLS